MSTLQPCSSEDEKFAFYLSLNEHVSKIPRVSKVFIRDDFNARVCKDCQTFDVIGKRNRKVTTANGFGLVHSKKINTKQPGCIYMIDILVRRCEDARCVRCSRYAES